MNYQKIFYLFRSAVFAIFGFLCVSTFVAAETFIPEPFLPVVGLGEYKPAIENMQNLLVQRQHSKFYSVAMEFLTKLRENQREEKRFEAKTREAEMAKEWTCYLITSAPLMEMDDFFILEKLPEKDDLYVDIYAKTRVMGIIQNTPFGVRRDAAKRRYKVRNGVDYREIFTIQEIRKIEIAHVAYYAAILKGDRDAYKKASVEKRMGTYLRTPGYSTTPLRFSFNKVMNNNEYREILENKKKEEEKENPNIGYEMSRLKDRRLSTLTSYGMPWGDAHKKGLVKLVVDCFPNDSASVREYLKKAGYVSDIALADALQSVYPRMKRTEWLFVGLPDEKTTEAFLTTSAFLKDPTVAKEMAEINEAVKEAIALKALATKRFNLLEAKLSEEFTAGAHREDHEKAREVVEAELRTAATSDNLQTWVALRKAEISLFSKLELQLVLQLQATKNPALLPPMQKYLKWVVAEKEILRAELAEKIR
jgi:hypothetical protein